MSRTPHIAYLRGDTLHVLPDPGAFATPELQLAAAWRNEAAVSGTCPVCSAVGLNRAQRRRLARTRDGKLARQVFLHERDCPAGDDRFGELLRAGGDVGD